MSVRTPILLVALLVAAVIAVAASGSAAGLLMLTPALAVLLPLLAGNYPGEKSVARLVCWVSRLRRTDLAGSIRPPPFTTWTRPTRDGFAAANGNRGPPLFIG